MGVAPNHQLNRMFHYINQPFWGSPICGNTHVLIGFSNKLISSRWQNQQQTTTQNQHKMGATKTVPRWQLLFIRFSMVSHGFPWFHMVSHTSDIMVSFPAFPIRRQSPQKWLAMPLAALAVDQTQHANMLKTCSCVAGIYPHTHYKHHMTDFKYECKYIAEYAHTYRT